VTHPDHHLVGFIHDLSTGHALETRDHADAAILCLALGSVESLGEHLALLLPGFQGEDAFGGI
jgi:hypothetical protein